MLFVLNCTHLMYIIEAKQVVILNKHGYVCEHVH